MPYAEDVNQWKDLTPKLMLMIARAHALRGGFAGHGTGVVQNRHSTDVESPPLLLLLLRETVRAFT